MTVMLALRVNPPLLFVRLLKVVAPFKVCTPAALSITPPPWPLNVPLLFQVPLTIKAKLLVLASRVVPDPMVRLPLTVTAPPKDFVPLPLVVTLL